MRHLDSGPLLRNLRHDLPASLVVFLVALPLSLGIAIASGAPLMGGLIAAVVGGIVAGSVGGSALQVSGPAAGLTVVVAGLIADFGWAMTCIITICAGAIQILFGVVKVARAALGVAPVVVHAMLAGIGVTIVLQQVHVLMGGKSRSSAWENIKALPNGIMNHELNEVIVGGIVIGILLLWPKLPAKIRFIPGALVAIVVATAVAEVAHLEEVDRINLKGDFFKAVGLPHLPATAPGGAPWMHEVSGVAVGIITVALIASVESLLSAVAVDKLHNGPRANFNREMIGQGSANMLSGLLGGLPVTGVIVRSSTNVAAGARTRTSAVLHGVWILLFASLLTGLVELIPKAALAGLLIVIGIQLIKLAHIKLAWRTGNFAIYSITIVCVVFLNLLEGVALGLAVAIFMLLTRLVRAPIEARPYGDGEAKNWRIDIDGTLSFLLLPRLTQVLSNVPPGSHVRLTLNADYIDEAVSEAISDWRRSHEATGGVVVIVERSPATLHHAHTSRPKRHYQRPPKDAVSRASQNGEHHDAGPSILDGVDQYHRNGRDELYPRLAELTDTPTPTAVFITCADSRILPDVITASGPGELYIVRNVGNLVPADGADRSVDAALDVAFNHLGVTSVVVCGHSSCRAMDALLAGATDQTATGQWLEHAHESLDAFQNDHPARGSADGVSEADQLSIVNVVVQMERLAANPILAGAKESGALRIYGMFFDISTAHVYEVDQDGLVRPVEPAGAQ
ncbi:bifunctional SulP family inorganic anion transporter/carbonic anhydrase [Mycobacterium sp.]|uniref:bifunctional SulP family inorganic anion transporter/carbonic anhydrase n=1 Tax=Mycobacterium sp. TaxID=1785 RepID=UPI002BECAE3F|nr:bifunctional SulP family inorganic anion transporter/carbonic anhydrase [Mycobacterium sp.]HTQ15852.1 bifunctional SulP family inorganic anion transporter/carbonic anhydrase [Mycobacterium sp.]